MTKNITTAHSRIYGYAKVWISITNPYEINSI